MDLSLIFKLAGVGVLLFIVDEILKICDKGNYAKGVNIVAIIIMLGLIVNEIASLLDEVKTIFMF